MKIFLSVLSLLLVFITLLPVVKSDYWIFRVFDYPRLQKFFFSAVCLVMLIYYFDSNDKWICTLNGLMVFNLIYLAIIVAPYTVIGKKQVLRIDKVIEGQGLSIMISNVYQDNENYTGCLAEIEKANPDIVVLLEVDSLWAQHLVELDKEYPHSVKVPLDNTYGMMMFSRLELKNAGVKYLVEEGIPSIHTEVILKNGRPIQLYAVHPTPPVPSENPRATERDKELLLVADLARKSTLPVIVAGDLNDVAWSHTTSLFLKMSKLLDPRRGRGFYNSFHAHYFFLRFPLDHAFISTDFKLKEMRRLNNYNSDHFPIFLSLQYEDKAPAEQKPMEAAPEDVEEAREKKQKA